MKTLKIILAVILMLCYYSILGCMGWVCYEAVHAHHTGNKFNSLCLLCLVGFVVVMLTCAHIINVIDKKQNPGKIAK